MFDDGKSNRQRVLVTGASSGIGEAIAHQLASMGYTVGCLSRRGTIAPHGNLRARLLPIECDITDYTSLETTLKRFAGKSGRLAGLVNSAGIHRGGASAELTIAELRLIVETNFTATFGVCRAAYPYLRKRGGLIVNIGSFYDRLGVRSNLAYSASKAAVASMTRTLAVEWARDKIAVVNLAPGYVLTELNRELMSQPGRRLALEEKIPVGRIGAPEEVGRLVAAIFEVNSTFLTGATIYMDGGQGLHLQAEID